jgi:hypothetical protein
MVDIKVVDCLDMNVWLGAITGVPAPSKHVTRMHPLSWPDRETAPLKMTERHHNALAIDEYMVPGKCCPPRPRSTPLGERVADRRETAVRRMVRFRVIRSDDDPIHGCQQVAPVAGEQFRWFGARESAHRDRRCAPLRIDGDEIDRI